MRSNNWTREQLLIAINLYCQLPFGKLHKGNPLIIETAKLMGRTSSSLAMKLTNLASLDPVITESGRKGLPGCSKLDEQVWAEFMANPDAIGYESQLLVDALVQQDRAVLALSSESEPEELLPSYYSENAITQTAVRVKQSFFRKAVLSSYEGRCCMTGLADTRSSPMHPRSEAMAGSSATNWDAPPDAGRNCAGQRRLPADQGRQHITFGSSMAGWSKPAGSGWKRYSPVPLTLRRATHLGQYTGPVPTHLTKQPYIT